MREVEPVKRRYSVRRRRDVGDNDMRAAEGLRQRIKVAPDTQDILAPALRCARFGLVDVIEAEGCRIEDDGWIAGHEIAHPRKTSPKGVSRRR